MKLFNNKRAELVTIILIIIVIVFSLGWLINLGSRECRTNSQCGSGSYCGSDFACHQIPVIEKTIVQNNLLIPSIIIGLAIIIAAIVLKPIKFHSKKNPEQEIKKENINKNPLKIP